MLSQRENELLTQTGPGTPCGELMRRYWQPVALAEELPPGGPPIPIRLLSEDLALFRDDQGRPGLLGIHCSHRAADLSYGRVEDGGLRCLYHGWLYDIRGNCLEQPGEPARPPVSRPGSESGSSEVVVKRFHEKIRHTAYPCVERIGIVFAYLGPGEAPVFPEYAFLNAPEGHYRVNKLLHVCNYMQSNEGNYDLSHLTFLHYTRQNRGVGGGRVGPNAVIGEQERISGRGAAPGVERAEAEATPYSVRSFKVREDVGSDNYHLYLTEYVLPNFTVIPGASMGQGGYAVNWHVPIDDTHHWKYSIWFMADEPIGPDESRKSTQDEQYHPLRNQANRYLQDRREMLTDTYLGMGYAFQIHDLFATESEGAIQDRTTEHLGAMDKAVIAARRLTLQAIARLEGGEEPANVWRRPPDEFPKFVSYRGVLPASKSWKDVPAWLSESKLGQEGNWQSAVPIGAGR